MSIGKHMYTCGLLAALAVLPAPVEAAASDSPTVRITRPVAGRIVLDVADDSVAVRKEVTADRSVVTMATALDRVSLTIRRGVVSVTGPDGTVTIDARAGVDAGRLSAVLQRSDAAAKARRLLSKVSDGPGTFAGQSLLLTRTILEMGTSNASALSEHRRWVAERAAQDARAGRLGDGPRVIRAAYVADQKLGPGECWDLYHKEAIRIADDFAECTEDLRWWEAHLWAACSLVYAVRSEGAMAWYIACNGGVPFSG